MTSVAQCSVPVCERPVSSRGYCAAHYKRFTSGGDLDSPISPRRKTPEPCPAPECPNMIRNNGYCQSHAAQFKRLGYVTHVLFRQGHGERVACLIPECDKPIRSRVGSCKNHLKTLTVYRLSTLQYSMLMDSGCGICGSLENLVIDHDHACCDREVTGRNTCGECIRGVLCQGCNMGLGLLGDSYESLSRALRYLSGSNVN